MDFTASKPDVVRSVRHRWLLNYWERLRRGTTVPPWKALDAEELSRMLENMQFCDVVGTGAAMASAKMTVWGDPNTVSKISENFFRGQSFGFLADGLVNSAPDALKAAAADFAQKLGGNGAEEPNGDKPAPGDKPPR